MGALLNRRRYMGGGAADEIIMTSTSNPEVLAVCYAQGWCADANYMTKSEAEAVTSIGTAFRNNTSITHFEEFQYFTAVISITGDGFRGCTNLINITLPKTIINIGSEGFRGCTKLESINLSNIQRINYFGFYSCASLTAVNLEKCQYLGGGAFCLCSNLTSIGSLSSLTEFGDNNYGQFQQTLLSGNFVFDNLISTFIPGRFIYGSHGITSVSFLSPYTYVGSVAFQDTNIQTFSVIEGCTTINNHSFSCSYLKYIDLPSTLIHWYGFALYGNGSQKVIVCRALTPPSIDYPGEDTKTSQKSFFLIPASCKVYVPSASIDTYKAADGWRALKDRMLPVEGSWYETHREIDPNDE